MNLTNTVFTRFTGMHVLLLLLLLVGSVSVGHAASLTSTVNRNTMSTNETVTLTVVSDQQVDASALVLDELRQDFEILNIAPRNSTSIATVNGKTTRVASTQWTLSLAAKRAGELRIPVFTVNQSRSRAITIKALAPQDYSANHSAPASPLIASGLAEKVSIYPGEQLIYSIELSAARSVRDLSGSALEIDGASVELIEQPQFQRIENGLARTVVILKYAIFAEASGTLTIPAITFTGLVGAQRSLFGNQGQKVIGRTQSLSITVKAKPVSNNSAPWFPASDVSISSSWSSDPNELRTGAPITRSITINAQGQLADAIAPLNQAPLSAASIKSYKDKPQLNSNKTNTGFNSTRIESEAIVVNEAGKVELPAIDVHWFNVNTQTWQQATLAAETLTVSGQAVASTSPTALPTMPNASTALSASPPIQGTHWAWPLATALFALICLVQSYCLFTRKPQIQPESPQPNTSETEAKRWKQLSKALNKGDPQRIRNSLDRWAVAAHPDKPFINLMTLAQQADSPLASALEQLDSALFSKHSQANLHELIDELRPSLHDYRTQLIKQGSALKKNQRNQPLAPLYPA